jgi:hypothetical protein
MVSEFKGPDITKTRGGLGRTSDVNEDKIFGLVCGGVTTDEYPALGTIKKLTQLSDAEDLGFNAAYDVNNEVLVYNTIKRFFEYDPDGVLYIMLVGQGTSLENMCDKTLDNIFKLVTDEFTERKIKYVGAMLNPLMNGEGSEENYEPTYTTGIDADVIAAIPKAQALIEELKTMGIFLDGITLEGRLDPVMSTSTLYDLRALTNDGVSVVVAQDPAIAALHASFANSADVGSALGMRCVRKVSESLGSADIANKPERFKGTETYPLTRVATSLWLSANLSSGKKFSQLTETDKSNLAAKGYIYAGKYEGMDGFFFNDGHNCIAATDDYAYQEDNAARGARRALLPIMKGEIEVDPATGFLPPSQIAYYQAKAAKEINKMAKSNEISGEARITIVPNQDVVGTGKVVMSIGYVRRGILRKLEASIGAINPAA